MASNYPTSLDAFTTGTLTGVVSGSDHGNKGDAINKIEAELGVIPSGAAATVAARLASLAISVKDHGALGDNSNDDTAEIQAAVDAASSSGRAVLIPHGTYRVSSAISIPNYVQIFGCGESSIVRCTGNHFAFSLNPGNRSAISNLQIDALTEQTSGGAISGASAGSNVWVDGIYFGSNLFYGLDLSPAAAVGVFRIRRCRWNGITGCETAIRVGGGAGLITDVSIQDCVGTATADADMVTWVLVPSNADTLKMTDCLFYRGGTGWRVGSTTEVTQMTFTTCTADEMANEGFEIGDVRSCVMTACEVSTCGASGVPGLEISGSATGTRFVNSLIQNCDGYGIIVRDGSLHTVIDDSVVSDNNTTNSAFQDGIYVGANATKFRIVNNTVGNSVLLASGHQKTGIAVGAGTSNDYHITGNSCYGNETANVVDDQGTGTNKAIRDNLPATLGSVASAATTTLATYTDMWSVTGTTNITSVTASYVGRIVTLVFVGVLTFTDGSNLKLAGNFVTTADDTITLRSDGTNWYEMSRSVN